jgi:hypothetical protein
MDPALPYGLRDVKLTPFLDQAGSVIGTPIDLPAARTFSFSDEEDFTTLRGDDREVASHGSGPSVSWDLESGGLPFEAYQAMAGGTIVTTGTGATQTKVYSKKVTDSRPYFRIEGQSISDGGGDVHCILPRCKATGELSGEFGDGEFFLTKASGVAIAPVSGMFQDEAYRFIQNAAVTPIAAAAVDAS